MTTFNAQYEVIYISNYGNTCVFRYRTGVQKSIGYYFKEMNDAHTRTNCLRIDRHDDDRYNDKDKKIKSRMRLTWRSLNKKVTKTPLTLII